MKIPSALLAGIMLAAGSFTLSPATVNARDGDEGTALCMQEDQPRETQPGPTGPLGTLGCLITLLTDAESCLDAEENRRVCLSEAVLDFLVCINAWGSSEENVPFPQ